MRIIVISDSHGGFSNIERIYQKHRSADLFLHLGDGERDFDRFVSEHPDAKYTYISGNCDLASFSPDEAAFAVGFGHSVFAVHGHKFNVKYTLEPLKAAGKKRNCDILLFGHTHVPMTDYDDGVWILNPGAASNGCYGIVDVVSAGVSTALARL